MSEMLLFMFQMKIIYISPYENENTFLISLTICLWSCMHQYSFDAIFIQNQLHFFEVFMNIITECFSDMNFLFFCRPLSRSHSLYRFMIYLRAVLHLTIAFSLFIDPKWFIRLELFGEITFFNAVITCIQFYRIFLTHGISL